MGKILSTTTKKTDIQLAKATINIYYIEINQIREKIDMKNKKVIH